MPEAEVEVTEPLVRDLVHRQFPDVAGPLRRVANGWDNVIFRLGDDAAVRLPRRELGARLVLHEQRWLPVIAPQLPISVPVPLWCGRPDESYPWSWSIVPWFAGRQLAEVPTPERTTYAAAIGDCYARLHTQAPSQAPANPVRGTPLPARTELLDQHLSLIELAEEARVRALWAELSGVPAWTRAPVWLHGDPHPGNVLVEDGRVTAMIDFGDLTGGDPATDLAAAWLAFDPAGRAAFTAAYEAERTVTEHTWQRARGWALCLAVALLAHTDDEPVLGAVGRHALHQVLDH